MLKKPTKHARAQQPEFANRNDLLALHDAFLIGLPVKKRSRNTLLLLTESFYANIEGHYPIPPAPWSKLAPGSLRDTTPRLPPDPPEPAFLPPDPDPPLQLPVDPDPSSPPRTARVARVFSPNTTLVQGLVATLGPGPEKNATVAILGRAVRGKTRQAELIAQNRMLSGQLNRQQAQVKPLAEALAAQSSRLNDKQRMHLFAATCATAHDALNIDASVVINRDGRHEYALPVSPQDRGQALDPVSAKVKRISETLLKPSQELPVLLGDMKTAAQSYAHHEQQVQLRFLQDRLKEHKLTKPNPDKVLAVLDAAGISLKKYERLSRADSNMLRVGDIKKRRLHFNELASTNFELRRAATPHRGSWVTATSLFTYLLRQEPLPSGESTVRALLGGDGRNMDRNHKQTILATRILNERKTEKTRRVHKLAVLDGEENYAALDVGLKSLRDELELISHSGLVVDGRMYNFEFWWASDLKFLHLARGYKSCRAARPCAWCKVQQSDFSSFAKRWTVDEDRSNTDKKLADLFNFIPLSRTVPDNLHCLLRHWDLLFELFICELWEVASSAGLSMEKTDAMCSAALTAEFARDARITFKTWPSKENRVINSKPHIGFPSLMGPKVQLALEKFKPSRCLAAVSSGDAARKEYV